MIQWTFVQKSNRYLPANLDACFSEPEQAEYRRFIVPKRAGEWLFSRRVVKSLVKHVFGPDCPAFRDIRVCKEPGGAPFVEIGGRRAGWLSLSHSGRGALAAFSTDPGCRFGVDLETVEPRSPEMIADFFTAGEMSWVLAQSRNDLDLAANLVWSAKEAYLKAIGLGLGMDTRRIEIMSVSFTETGVEWQDLNFKVDGREDDAWRLVFRREPGYILTACLMQKPGIELVHSLLSS